MFESIISACKALDAFGLPRAAGNLHTDRFIVANESFLRIAGLGKDEILITALSEIVKIDFASADPLKIGRLIPITVRTADQAVTIGGQAAISEQGIAFLMIPLFIDPSPDFEIGTAVGRELQRQRVAAYVHDYLASELLAATFEAQTEGAESRLNAKSRRLFATGVYHSSRPDGLEIEEQVCTDVVPGVVVSNA